METTTVYVVPGWCCWAPAVAMWLLCGVIAVFVRRESRKRVSPKP